MNSYMFMYPKLVNISVKCSILQPEKISGGRKERWSAIKVAFGRNPYPEQLLEDTMVYRQEIQSFDLFLSPS